MVIIILHTECVCIYMYKIILQILCIIKDTILYCVYLYGILILSLLYCAHIGDNLVSSRLA